MDEAYELASQNLAAVPGREVAPNVRVLKRMTAFVVGEFDGAAEDQDQTDFGLWEKNTKVERTINPWIKKQVLV